jgi:pimeloyl-ACP methyl ester carboxylesterase
MAQAIHRKEQYMNHARWRRCVATLIAVSVTPFIFPGRPAAAVSAPGSVLLATPATLPSELSSLATGKRISYATTAVNGSSLNATGLVLTPKTGKTNKTVVWGHGTTGLADQCAPSNNQAVFWPEARAAIAALLAKGWTVAAPDYPGLGTPAAHPYLIGASEARSMIDTVKAARQLDPALSTQYAIDGHSQGGQGALFAGELAPAYDGNLTLTSVVSIAPVSNAQVFAPLVPGTPGQGYLVMGLYGLQAIDPSVNALSLLAAPAKLRTPVLTTGCLYEILNAYQSLTSAQLLTNGALPQSVLTKLAHYDNPGQQAPTAPILLVQGTNDEAVPYDLTAGPLLEQLESYHTQPIQFESVEGANHDGAVFQTTALVADWIAAHFS